MARLSRRGLLRGIGIGAAAAAVAPAFQATPVHARPTTFTKVIDLTHTMSPRFPTFFGVPGVELEKQFDFDKDGFNLNWWRIVEHAGTHMDAPIHFSKDGNTVEKIPAEQLVAPLAVVDIKEKAATDPDALVTVDDLTAWEAEHGEIPAGACVAMNSGWAAHVGDAAKFTGKDADGKFHFPGFAVEAAQFLMNERTVVGLAVDTLSLDHGPSADFKTHYAWLPSGRWGLENVANLDQVPAVGATLVVGQAKVENATGGPSRLLALV